MIFPCLHDFSYMVPYNQNPITSVLRLCTSRFCIPHMRRHVCTTKFCSEKHLNKIINAFYLQPLTNDCVLKTKIKIKFNVKKRFKSNTVADFQSA